MYIQPNTVIKVYNNIPLDNTYEHTLYFDSVTAQNNYFHPIQGRAKYTLTANTYQRVNKETMRVSIASDNLYDCNYIAFQNSSFGSKWFYGFITKVEYINNETSEITYEIDVMQTYLFNVKLGDCFVEREHATHDVFDDWLAPEDLETGEYIVEEENFLSFGTPHAIMRSAYNPKDLEREPMEYYTNQGLMSGLGDVGYPLTTTGATSLTNDLDYIAEHKQTDAIVDICVAFNCCVAIKTEHEYVQTFQKPRTLNGYTPKNKKLLTSPYCMLLADNNIGGQSTYYFELFGNNFGHTYSQNFSFEAIGNLDPTVTVWAVPKNYKGCDINYNEALVCSGYASIPYQSNAFKEWYAGNKNTLTVATALAGGEAVKGAVEMIATRGVSGSNELATGIAGVAGIVARIQDHKVGAIQARGRSTGDGLIFALGLGGVKLYTKTITRQMAKIIDDFFTKYGYATNRIKQPNRSSRPHWNYVKTVDCLLLPNGNNGCPSDDMKKICSIYDNGITFWKDASEVGDYSLDNSPV